MSESTSVVFAMSWKSAAKTNQKTHRERHQPAARKHLGILEKKKDYKLRAKHYNEQRESIRFFKRKALDKNSDEFYHHMVNSRVKDGVHKEKPKAEEELTEDQLKLMRNQDARYDESLLFHPPRISFQPHSHRYIDMKHQIEQRKVQRMQANLHMIDAANEIKNTHKFFADTNEEIKNFDLCKHLDTHESLLGRKTNRLKLKDLEKLNIDQFDASTLARMNQEKSKAYRELEKRIERERDLAVVKTRMQQRLQKKAKPAETETIFGWDDAEKPEKKLHQDNVYIRKR